MKGGKTMEIRKIQPSDKEFWLSLDRHLGDDGFDRKVRDGMGYVLLKDGAKRAAEIKEEFVPTFPSIEAFFQAIDRLDMDKDAVIYNEDGSVTLDYKK